MGTQDVTMEDENDGLLPLDINQQEFTEEETELPDDDIEVEVVDDAEPEAEPEAEPDAEPEAEAAAAEEEPESTESSEDDAELEEFKDQPKFFKRLKREQRAKAKAQQDYEQARELVRKAAGLVQQRDDEILSLRRENATVQRQYADTLEHAYDQAIQLKASELKAARENGDYDNELKAQGELDKMRFQQNQVREAKRTLPDPDSFKAQEVAQQQQQQQQQQQRPQASPLAVKWLDTNKSWFGNPKFAGHKAFVLAEDSKLIAEGYNPQSRDYYTELDRRVDHAFPSLRKKAVPAGKHASTVAPATVAAAPAAVRGKVQLTRADLGTMRQFGLDPNNKAHLREFARNKMNG